MTDFMISDDPFFLLGNHGALAFLAGDDRIDSFIKIRLHDLRMAVAHSG